MTSKSSNNNLKKNNVVTFYVSKETDTLLKELSVLERKTKSDIIRDALTIYLTQLRSKK